jgi:hypothetical protein
MLFQVHGRPPLEQLSWLMPARWGYAMGAGTTGVEGMPGTDPDPLWEAGSWPFGLAVQIVLTVVFAVSTLVVLRRRLNRR